MDGAALKDVSPDSDASTVSNEENVRHLEDELDKKESPPPTPVATSDPHDLLSSVVQLQQLFNDVDAIAHTPEQHQEEAELVKLKAAAAASEAARDVSKRGRASTQSHAQAATVALPTTTTTAASSPSHKPAPTSPPRPSCVPVRADASASRWMCSRCERPLHWCEWCEKNFGEPAGLETHLTRCHDGERVEALRIATAPPPPPPVAAPVQVQRRHPRFTLRPIPQAYEASLIPVWAAQVACGSQGEEITGESKKGRKRKLTDTQCLLQSLQTGKVYTNEVRRLMDQCSICLLFLVIGKGLSADASGVDMQVSIFNTFLENLLHAAPITLHRLQ